MLKEKIYPYFLVFVQLGSLVYILTSGPLLAMEYSGLLVESTGIFLGLLAIYNMGIGNFNITPTNRPGARMVDSGIYGIIRHPMYFAQLIAVLPLVIDYFSIVRLSVFLLLFIALLLKMNYEEKHLIDNFTGYADYMKRTKRLIPFIY